MLQAQQSQQKPTATLSAQARRMGLYSDWVLAALMGYAQVYTETGIPIIWGNFKFPRNVLKPPRTTGRDDVLGQDKWNRNLYSGILCKAGNRGDGKDKIQTGRPGGNV